MLGRSINLFEIYGFKVRADLTWIIIAILIAWSLSAGLFPFRYEGLPTGTYWIMGIVGAVGLFASIIFHELSHSIVARRFGMPIGGITLFIFGGVAEMKKEPPSAKAEFLMALAGPVSSFLMALVFHALFLSGRNFTWGEPVNGVLQYLSWINGVLAVFNLVPAFPLDGGRMLRSVLWGFKKDLRRATRIASSVGKGFGFLLAALGILQFVGGNFINGMWWFLIGIFIRNAAAMSYRQLLVRRALEGEPVRRFMKSNAVTVSPSITIQKLVEDYIYIFHFKLFPVVDASGRLMGCVTTKQVKDVPEEARPHKTVGDIAVNCSKENTIRPEADAVEALAAMKRTGSSRLMVTEDNRLKGIISLKDMLNFLDLKIDLE